MARQGYDGASVADVARVAGLTPGLVHHHFKNKQEILLVALRRLVERHEQRLEKRLADAAETAEAKVAAFIDVHLGLGADADPDALACWVLTSGEALRQPEVRTEFERAVAALVARLAEIIAEGIANGAFRCDEPATAAAAIVAAIQGYYVLAAAARQTIPPGSAAPSALRMAEGLLRPSGPLAPSEKQL